MFTLPFRSQLVAGITTPEQAAQRRLQLDAAIRVSEACGHALNELEVLMHAAPDLAAPILELLRQAVDKLTPKGN